MNNEGKEEVLKKLAFLNPTGATLPLPAIDVARRLLEKSSKDCKALILMSDAKFPQQIEDSVYSDFFSSGEIQLAVAALTNQGDLQSMQNLAKAGSGDFYIVSDISKTGKVLSDILRAWRLLK